jgi:hypothetical protein
VSSHGRAPRQHGGLFDTYGAQKQVDSTVGPAARIKGVPARAAWAQTCLTQALARYWACAPGELERLLSRVGWIHWSTFMRLRIVQAGSFALLLAGCAGPTYAPAGLPPVQHQNVYDKPLTSPGAKFSALPQVVQRTVLAEAGGAEVVDAVRDTSAGRVVYKVYFRDSEVYPPLFIAPDGSVLNPDLTVAVSATQGVRVKRSELPPKVVKAITDKAPGAEIAYINKEGWGDRIVYVVTFKDEAHFPKLLLAEDGTVVEETP